MPGDIDVPPGSADGSVANHAVAYWEWLYDHIESWWGDRLTTELSEKIAAAPKKHLAAFAESLTRYPAVFARVPMAPGTLRPLVVSNGFRTRERAGNVPVALRLLLYAQEVAIESDFLDVLYDAEAIAVDKSARVRLKESLTYVAMLRPAALQGSVHLTHVYSRAHHPSHAWTGWQEQLLADPEVFALAAGFVGSGDYWLDAYGNSEHPELVGVLQREFGVLHFACWLAEQREATPLARSEAELKILSASLCQQISDNRHSILSTLARLPVPDFSMDATLAARVRSDDEIFADWRGCLSAALGHIDAMPETADMAEAAAIVHAELSSATTMLTKSVRKSAFLESAKSGLADFGISAIGATATGLVTGSPWAALVSGASVQTAGVARAYIAAINKRRSERLVLDLVAAFMPTTGDPY